MSMFTTHPWTRWAVPTVAVVAVGGVTLGATVTADASTPLPPRTAAQLLVDIQGAQPAGLSGTVVQTSDLGIPDLPGLPSSSGGGIGAPSDLTSLVSGTHTLRVWYAGPTKTRVALLGSLGESDIVHNGKDLWVWSSRDKSATHYVLPAGSGDASSRVPDAAGAMTPDAAAKQALAAINPSTKVTTDGTARVAGRSAYELVLAPRDRASLVSQVRIAIDAKTHVPLRVQAYSKKMTNPAFQVGFTQVDFGMPEARQFAFHAPPGTTVKQGTLPTMGRPSGAGPTPDLAGGSKHVKVVGSGWTSVVVATMPTPASAVSGEASGADGSSSIQSLLGALPKVSGRWGSGHLFSGTLVSVVITNDGRIAAGAVAPSALYAALAAR